MELLNPKVLLVEDEESLAVGLEYNLSKENYQVVIAADGKSALEEFNSQDFDCVILDIMIPYINGFEVARQIREKSDRIPILFLTARTSFTDRVKGLEIGADDYLVKPFHLEELLLRVKGMLRRKNWYTREKPQDQTIQFGENRIDFSTLICSSGEKSFRLTPLEARIIEYLIENRERIVSKKELLREVWESPEGLETRTVENFIVRLRKRFEKDPGNPVHIRTVRGAGYQFEF